MKRIRFTFLLFILFFKSFNSVAQDVHPAVQALITDMSIWIDQQLAIKGSIDTTMLRQKSEYIKHVQDSVERIQVFPDAPGQVNKIGVVFTKSLMSGASIRVPEGKVWTILGVYIKNDIDPYRIKVTSWNYKTVYNALEYIKAPGTVSEDALIGEDSQEVTYDFDISETSE